MSRVFKFVILTLFVELTLGLDSVLIYPTTNPHVRFIVGFGVPVEHLEYETVVMGFAIRTKFKLPTSVKHLRTHDTVNVARGRDFFIDLQPVNTTHSADYANQVDGLSETEPGHHTGSAYRWAVYKGLEVLGDRMGLSGRVCVLKSICEAAGVPFHYQNGIYSEILHIVLSPSSSVDRISAHSDNEYFHAEMLGKSGAPCDRVFKECSRSFLDQFSNIYDMTKSIFEQFGK